MDPLNLDFDSVPWPDRGDQLFKESSDYQQNANLSLPGKDWGAYALGYKRAADALAERFLKDYKGMGVVAYPILYLYRHYVELQLKHIIASGSSLLAEQQDYEEIHELSRLWKPCREILQKISKQGFWPKDSPLLMDTVESLIKEFNKYDPDGFRFRYPLTTRRKGLLQSLPDDLKVIDIKNLYDVMQRLSSFLDSQIDGIHFYLTNKD